MNESLSVHRTALARELLDDIELSRLPATQLILKAARLARLGGEPAVEKWLGFELRGYVQGDETSLRYMTLTNRWTMQDRNLGWWGPLGEIEGHAKAFELELQQIRIPDVQVAAKPKSQYEAAWTSVNIAAKPAADALARMGALTKSIGQLRGVQSRVLAHLHDFVTSEYYVLEFSGLAETVFEKHKVRVDAVLRDRAGDAIEKVPAIYDRLSAGDQEAVSQAMNTCRRIIDAFADAVYAPRDGDVNIDGNAVAVGPSHTLNRINAYVAERSTSKARRDRIRRTLEHLYSRVAAGVHADVALDEAMTLFLQTYLTLGEIALLRDDRNASPPAVEPG